MQRIRGFGDDVLYKSMFYIKLHYPGDKSMITGDTMECVSSFLIAHLHITGYSVPEYSIQNIINPIKIPICRKF